MMVVLLVLALSAAGERSFYIDRPYTEVASMMEDRSGTPKDSLQQRGMEILAFNADQNNDRVHLTSHVRINSQEKFDLHIEGTVQQWPHATVAHAYTTKPTGRLAGMRTWIIISAAAHQKTRVQVYLEIRPIVPSVNMRFPLRWLAARINSRIAVEANRITSGIVKQGLDQAEQKIRATFK